MLDILSMKVSELIKLRKIIDFIIEDHKTICAEKDKAEHDMAYLLLLKPIEDLSLSKITLKYLQVSGIKYIGDLVIKKESDLLKICNFLNKCVEEINFSLVENSRGNFYVGKDIPNWHEIRPSE